MELLYSPILHRNNELIDHLGFAVDDISYIVKPGRPTRIRMALRNVRDAVNPWHSCYHHLKDDHAAANALANYTYYVGSP